MQATDPSELPTLERVDQIPMGPMSAVATDGDRAYLGLGPRLTVVDLSDPSMPQLIGFSDDLGDRVYDIAIDPGNADRIFVAAGAAGIWEAVVADPANPRAHQIAGGSAHSLRVEVDRLFVLGDVLRIFDRPVGSPAVALGKIEASIEALDVAGDLLWLALGVDGVASFDISDRTRPIRVGSLDTPGHAHDIRLRGPLGYVSDGGRQLRILDLRDPAEPRWLADYSVDISTESECAAHDPNCGLDSRWVHIHEDRLLLGSAYRAPWLTRIEGRLTLLDLTDPLDPRPIEQRSIDGSISDISFGTRVLVTTWPVWHESQAFFCRLIPGGLEVLDARLGTSGHFGHPLGANDLTLHQDRLYVAGRARWLATFDLEPVPALLPERWPTTSYGDGRNTEARHVLADESGSRIAFGYVSNPIDVDLDSSTERSRAGEAPMLDASGSRQAEWSMLHGCIPDGGQAAFRQLATDGSHDFGLDLSGGLQVFSPKSSGALVRIEGVSGSGLAAARGLVYVNDSEGLRILDARDPIEPTDLGRLTIDGYYGAIAVSELVDLAVMAGPSGLSIVDARRPEAPVALASIGTRGPIVDLAIQGHTVYVAHETRIQAFDLSDATRPVEGARIENLRDVQALAVDGTRVAVSVDGGVLVFEALPDDGSPPELPGPLYLPVLLRSMVALAPESSPRVVLQVADKGGLPSPPDFQNDIRQTPWFTLYSDGSYIRFPELDMHHPRTGRLDPDRLVAQVERFVGASAFFDYPADDDVHRCQTDGSTTHVLLDWRGRRHRVRSYLMYWMGKNPQRCPPGSPSMPIGLETARFYALANEVAALDRPLAADEHDAMLESATVYVDGDAIPSNRPIHPWPLERAMQASAGRDRLTPEELDDLARAIRRLRPWADAPFAFFENGDHRAAVGIRFEPAGWIEYCLGEPGCER